MKLLSSLPMALVVVLIASTSAFSQYTVVKVDGLGLIQKRLYAGVEQSFLKQFSVGLAYEDVEYGSATATGGGDYELQAKGVIPEVRYYAFHKRKTAPLGFFVGPRFRFSTLTETYSPNSLERKAKLINYGLITGYKFNYKMFVGEAVVSYGGGSIEDGFVDADRAAFRTLVDDEIFDDIKRNARLELSIGVVFPKIKTKTSGKY